MQDYRDYEIRQRQNLPNADLFTFDIHRLNWFLWGDIWFIVSSVMFLMQPFFLMFARHGVYTVERDANYYFFSKSLSKRKNNFV